MKKLVITIEDALEFNNAGKKKLIGHIGRVVDHLESFDVPRGGTLYGEELGRRGKSIANIKFEVFDDDGNEVVKPEEDDEEEASGEAAGGDDDEEEENGDE